MVVFFALLYALGSMILGGMLILTRVPGGYTAGILWGNALGEGSWNYPGFLLVAPWGVVSLPFLATWSMVFVAIGVGIGVSVGLLIAAQIVRDRRSATLGPGAVGSVAGLTPVMIALVTLGACCSTTAAATAGVGLVAQASGSTLDNLLINNWYLDLFQVVVVFVALLAQELVLRVYGGLLGLTSTTAPSGASLATAAPLTLRTIAGGALRAALLLAGVTWSLAMFAEWTTISPETASATLWFQWIFQHQLLAVVAVLVALFPSEVARRFAAPAPGRFTVALRVALLVAGLSLATWVPPSVAVGGASGFVNELFGVWGLPSSWGSLVPAHSPGLALYARWGLQYLLLGGFAIALAIAPGRVLDPLRTSAGEGDSRRDSRAPRAAPSDPSLLGRAPAGLSLEGARPMKSDAIPAAGGLQDP